MTDLAPLLILWGSQTGNAQDVAERIEREARMRHFAPCVQSMDSYVVANLPKEQNVIFVVSTTGQGEVPDSMKRFWTFLLNKNLPLDSLKGVGTAVFGLGDSGYLKYNVVAKKLDRRLEQLGAGSIAPRGLGDDQHPSGYEATLDPWVAGLWSALRKRHPLPAGIVEPAADDTTTELVPKFSVTVMRVPNGTDSGDVTVQQHGSHKGVGFKDGAKPSGTQPAAETLLRHSVAMPAACDEATVLASALSALKTAVEMDRLDAWTPSGTVPSAQDGVLGRIAQQWHSCQSTGGSPRAATSKTCATWSCSWAGRV